MRSDWGSSIRTAETTSSTSLSTPTTSPTRSRRSVTLTDDQDFVVRKAEPEDVPRIGDLYPAPRVAAVPMMPPALHTNDEDRSWFATQLAKSTHEAWVVERDGELLGSALLHPGW